MHAPCAVATALPDNRYERFIIQGSGHDRIYTASVEGTEI